MSSADGIGADTSAPTLVAGQVLLDVAQRAALAGGAELLQRVGRPTGVTAKSTVTDPVSDADRASERAVVKVLTADRPADGLLGEEGAERVSQTGLRWVIDPLDGTVNYLYGIPHSAVCVACEQTDGDDWHTLAAVVHDPLRGETFTAIRAGGAYLNRRRLAVSDLEDPGVALVATGFAYSAASRARQAEVAATLIPRVRDIRSSGSAALDLCWVAAGRHDGYYEDELALWDWSAGSLIVTEAGGKVTRLGSGVLASGAALHPRLLELVQTKRAT